jgi:transcriptional regulator with XRE-family HTH domain
MNSTNLLKVVLQQTGYSQKELSTEMKVSAAQISKWKAGEHMSFEMADKLRAIAGIGDRDPDVVYWTGGTEQADKWAKLVVHLAAKANENAECCYNSYPLSEGMDCLLGSIFQSLIEAGATIPKEFPAEIDFDYESDYGENEDLFKTLYGGNVYSSLIYSGLDSLAKLYDFYAAYIQDIFNDDSLDMYDTDASNIEPCLFSLALAKIGANSTILPNYSKFRYRTLRDYKEWVEIIKRAAIKHRIPLKAELMHLVSEDPECLMLEAEAEARGFNSNRLHPDIYMDEILNSLRVIHQVLPVICKKLGITEDELKFDESRSLL